MRLINKIFFCAAVFLFVGCNLIQPTAYFFITNSSEDQKSVDIAVSIAGETVFNDTINFTNVAPDLQYTPQKTLPKGKYTISIVANKRKLV